MLYDSDPLNQTSLHTLNNKVSLIIFEDFNRCVCFQHYIRREGNLLNHFLSVLCLSAYNSYYGKCIRT